MEKTTGYAVLGCGYFGAEFARAVSQMPGARLAAVYSPGESAGRVSRELGCPGRPRWSRSGRIRRWTR